jgi:hypothetical protein
MATNQYVVLNSKQYPVRQTRYEPTLQKAQTVAVTVGGAHVSQDFDFTEYRWGFDLYVPYAGDATWGGMSDIKTAYALSSCAFTDHYGTAYTVYFEGPLPEMPDGPMLDGAGGNFTVPVNLRRKQ